MNGRYPLATAFGLAQGLCSFLIVIISNKIASKVSNQPIFWGADMKKTFIEKIFDSCNTVFILILCTATIYPYVNMLAVSFNDSADSALGGITVFPRIFTFANHVTILVLKKDIEGITIINPIGFLRILEGT